MIRFSLLMEALYLIFLTENGKGIAGYIKQFVGLQGLNYRHLTFDKETTCGRQIY